MTRQYRPTPATVNVTWVETKGAHHLFAGHRAGLISMCGQARHPQLIGDVIANTFCFTCLRNYRAVTSGTRWL